MAVVSWWDEALEALSVEPFFAQMRIRSAGTGLEVCENLFNTYVRAVCGQQVNTVVAEKTALKVLDFAGDNPATRLAATELDELHALGLTVGKANALQGLARGFLEGRLTLEALSALDDAAAKERLVSVKGVGPWTADMVLIFGLNRPDVWAIGDFGLRKALAESPLADKDCSLWVPWRTAATWLLWRSRTAEPVRYGY